MFPGPSCLVFTCFVTSCFILLVFLRLVFSWLVSAVFPSVFHFPQLPQCVIKPLFAFVCCCLVLFTCLCGLALVQLHLISLQHRCFGYEAVVSWDSVDSFMSSVLSSFQTHGFTISTLEATCPEYHHKYSLSNVNLFYFVCISVGAKKFEGPHKGAAGGHYENTGALSWSFCWGTVEDHFTQAEFQFYGWNETQIGPETV